MRSVTAKSYPGPPTLTPAVLRLQVVIEVAGNGVGRQFREEAEATGIDFAGRHPADLRPTGVGPVASVLPDPGAVGGESIQIVIGDGKRESRPADLGPVARRPQVVIDAVGRGRSAGSDEEAEATGIDLAGISPDVID